MRTRFATFCRRVAIVLRVCSAGSIVVGNDDHIGAGEVLIILAVPLAGALWVCRRHQAEPCGRVHIPFALDHEHRMIAGDRLEQFGKAVEHQAHAIEIPDPAAVAIWPPLAKRLRLEAANLKQQLAGFIGVVVLGNLPAELAALAVGLGPRLRFGGQRLDRTRKIAVVEKLRQIDDIAAGAAAAAVEDLLVRSDGNRKPIRRRRIAGMVRLTQFCVS